ncbi:MAG: hypothetical protein WCT40_04395 [Candidatus Magasanikbacteria bacterium]|jgi:hypothetical protein
MFFKKIYNLGDKLEDKVRGKLSHFPIIYAFIGGVGVIIFWRGVWHTTDFLMGLLFSAGHYASTISLSEQPWWDGPLSILVGSGILLMTGLFVSNFIGNEIIISGLKKEKRIAEKTEEEILLDISKNEKLQFGINAINERLENIEIMLKK